MGVLRHEPDLEIRRRSFVARVETPSPALLPSQPGAPRAVLRCELAAPGLLYVILAGPAAGDPVADLRERVEGAAHGAGLHVDVAAVEPRFTGGRTIFAVRELGARLEAGAIHA